MVFSCQDTGRTTRGVCRGACVHHSARLGAERLLLKLLVEGSGMISALHLSNVLTGTYFVQGLVLPSCTLLW